MSLHSVLHIACEIRSIRSRQNEMPKNEIKFLEISTCVSFGVQYTLVAQWTPTQGPGFRSPVETLGRIHTSDATPQKKHFTRSVTNKVSFPI